ncbi:MAG: AbrB/MazE/SpoVT family DNA-binding domain-containing protein [Tepidisphaeraceae bacterium]
MASATLTSKWQMVLPKPVREHLGVRPGDQVDFIIQDDGTVMVRPTVFDARDLKGICATPRLARPVSVEEMNRAVRRHARRSA